MLETAVDSVVDHGSPPVCAKMLRDIVFRTHLDVVCRALSGDPPARKKPGAVRFHSEARVVRAKAPPERNRLRWGAAESCPDCRSVVTIFNISKLTKPPNWHLNFFPTTLFHGRLEALALL